MGTPVSPPPPPPLFSQLAIMQTKRGVYLIYFAMHHTKSGWRFH